jgi:hypothetical protein
VFPLFATASDDSDTIATAHSGLSLDGGVYNRWNSWNTPGGSMYGPVDMVYYIGTPQTQVDDETQKRTHNGQNQITSIDSASLSYDSNGNTTADGSGRTYTYDAWNRMAGAGYIGVHVKRVPPTLKDVHHVHPPL